MRVGFRRTPVDLVIGAVLALSILPLVLAGIGGAGRYVLALALVFLLPGYGIVATLFPEDGALDWIRRVALSVGLSIAAVALLGLLLDLTPGGLTVGSIVGSLLLLSLGSLACAGWRRLRLPEGDRLGLTIELVPVRWQDLGRGDRLLAAGVAVALVSGVAVMAVGLANPPASDRYTEFYLLDPNGSLIDYPLSLNATGQGTVIVGIHNLEGMNVNYTVIVLLVSLRTVYNATTGTNETVEGNSTFLDSFPANVSSGATSEAPYTFPISAPGEFLVEFRLYMGVPQGPPYRFVDLRVTVT